MWRRRPLNPARQPWRRRWPRVEMSITAMTVMVEKRTQSREDVSKKLPAQAPHAPRATRKTPNSIHVFGRTAQEATRRFLGLYPATVGVNSLPSPNPHPEPAPSPKHCTIIPPTQPIRQHKCEPSTGKNVTADLHMAHDDRRCRGTAALPAAPRRPSKRWPSAPRAPPRAPPPPRPCAARALPGVHGH